jgi:RNAse (barnase) inhibitor barstar
MIDDLAGLLDGGRRPGVYRAGPGEFALSERTVAAGWQVAEVGPFDDLEGFYDQVADALGLPRYFGRNLDALWDCLTDLIEPTALIIADWSRFALPEPRDAARLLAVLTDRTREGSPFAVVLANRGALDLDDQVAGLNPT